MCLDAETQVKFYNSTTIMDDILRNHRYQEDKTILVYEGMSDRNYASNHGFALKQQDTSQKKSDIPTEWV